MNIPTAILFVTYILVVFVLPIFTACRFLLRRRQSRRACVAVAIMSLMGGFIGCVIAFLLGAWLLPKGHEMIDWERMLGSVFLGVLVGLPLGSWSGAWAVVWFVVGRS